MTSHTFDMAKASTADAQKIAWLWRVSSGKEPISVRENEPLMQLLRPFAHLLISESSGIDHDTVLRIFEAALNGKWPQGDRCITRTRSKKRKSPKEC